jgi:hypothetical protein
MQMTTMVLSDGEGGGGLGGSRLPRLPALLEAWTTNGVPID